MRTWLIRLLAMMIALVVPLQATAAVVAGQCMAFGHHDTAGGNDHHGQAAAGDHKEHKDYKDHQDHRNHASHAGDSTGAAQSDEGDIHSAHCGACTACCASVWIAGPGVASILSSPPTGIDVFWQFPPIGVQPTAFYRPPLVL